ncbi:unnamed protein product, partial [marine sediment metagenome]
GGLKVLRASSFEVEDIPIERKKNKSPMESKGIIVQSIKKGIPLVKSKLY